MTTDTYMKNYCAAMDRLEQLEKALDGLDLFMDIWESSFDTVAPDGLDKTLRDVQNSAHIYLDGFRAALARAGGDPHGIGDRDQTGRGCLCRGCGPACRSTLLPWGR